MPEARFNGSFTQQEPISDEAIAAAVGVMRSGRLHRYNCAQSETAETALLEQEFAAYQGTRYCLACASGGYAMHVALRAFGLKQGEPVVTNAFTLSPVPGAIHSAGGHPIFVESTENLTLDLNDLARKIDSSGARLLLISHMRGHIVDMGALLELLDGRGVTLIEDCAHTMGATWRGRKSGTFGVAACFSTQTYKHLNSGEGGLLTTDDADLMARAIVLSGSYMLYRRHLAGPPPESYSDIPLDVPNCSGRMDNLRAAILRPQLRALNRNVARWKERYQAIALALAKVDGLRLPVRSPEEGFVGSSIQFLVATAPFDVFAEFHSRCCVRGVELSWFGAREPAGYTSRHDSWRYLSPQQLPQTDAILCRLFDMRIPLTFTTEDCRLIGRIIGDCYAQSTASAGLVS
jgi:dTDP-4-amino-4,6-dideoxygalactose transaminase